MSDASPTHPSRRDVLLGGVALAGLAAFPRIAPVSAGVQGPPSTPGKTRVLRLAHLTDLHIQPERRADEGVRACLRHVNAMSDKPGLILTGGDLIMDGFKAGADRTQLQFDLLVKAFRDEGGVPVEHCLGNHDIWGWNKSESGATGAEPRWGKAWACEALGLPGPYRSFDRAGWHFVVLDSVNNDPNDPNDPNGYIGKLGDAQMDWLRADLARVPQSTPVLVISHIPILSATVVLGRPDEKTLARRVSGGILHVDSPELRDLFAQRGNVKLCLSGHLHRLDRVDFRGTTYLCNGAVSGNWWKGQHHEVREGYAVVDLFSDGSFTHDYVTYGWQADPA